jgi:S-DNA-T family DNA segregation ATPase FtsK/SpoIIIE
MISKVIAAAAFEIVKHRFLQSGDSKRLCIRIKNFSHDEVISFLDTWDLKANNFGFQYVTVVVAHTEKIEIPLKYLAKDTLTKYRNNIPEPGGLVYLETSVQSDAQGLQNIFTLTDSNFLDCSFDDPNSDELRDVKRLVVEKAWEVVGGNSNEKPSQLIDRTVEVINLLHPSMTIPVRRFAAFALGICSEWLTANEAQSEAQVNAIVGRNLIHLEFFPDESWRLYGDTNRTGRRLYQNAMHADLVNGTADIDITQLTSLIQGFTFLNEQNLPYSEVDLDLWRNLCIEYLKSRSAGVRSKIPYAVFSQLFIPLTGDTKGLKLGQRVKEEITSVAFIRVQELLTLNIIEGLDGRVQEDAQRFLDEESSEIGLPPLRDLISKKTKKLIENLATPPSKRFFDPMHRLVLLVRRYLELQNEDSSGGYVSLSISKKANLENCSIGLFAFLFGSTLRSICDISKDSLGGLELRVSDEALLAPTNFPLLFSEEDESLSSLRNDDSEDEPFNGMVWEPLPLQFAIHAEDGSILESFYGEEWFPENIEHFAMFWLLIGDPDSPIRKNIGALVMPADLLTEDWFEQAVLRITPLDSLSYIEPFVNSENHPVINDLLNNRSKFFDKASEFGISIQNINEYIDSWLPILETIRKDFVPKARNKILDAFLSNDHIVLDSNDNRLMCPYHPIRLRWIVSYLRQGQRLALATLANEKEMELYSPNYYLNWLGNLSPNHSPPITHGKQGDILYSKNETGWFEEFSPIESSAPNISMDSKSVDCISRQIIAYLESHPYKNDGLSILIILPPTDTFPSELVEIVRKHEWKNLRVKVTVALPIDRWEAVARSFERLHAGDRHSSRQALFPPNDLSFIEFNKQQSISEKIQSECFDLAIVTNILQESVIVQHNTEPPSHITGSFDPLLDTSTKLDCGEQGGAISIVMRPRNPDTILESWSTLVVRSNRSSPVSSSQEENTDFVELRIDFDSSSRLFSTLHKYSHWVITLERHISRQQIESIEAAPDILSILEGVGTNGLSTLIVSSSSGRDFIISRLERKLCKLIPSEQLAMRNKDCAKELAIRAYDETRSMAPSLVLRAMGVSRVTEEIIGIAVARNIANNKYCPNTTNGISAWISLDDHAEWFGGAGSTRADLMWISMTRDNEEIVVDIVIVEGKLRQAFDSHGIQQVKSTVEFIESVLSKSEIERVDAKLWREKILSAIELASPKAGVVQSSDSNLNFSGEIPLDIREKFREGIYRLQPLRGLYSICLWNSSSHEIQIYSKDGVEVVQSSQRDILALTEGNVPKFPKKVEGNQIADLSIVEASSKINSSEFNPINADISLENIPDIRNVEGNVVPTRSTNVVQKNRLSGRALQLLYQQILDCFASHQVQVKPVPLDQQPFIEGPASILFKVLPFSGVDPRKLIEKSRSLKLELRLDAEQEIAFGIDKGYVTIDVPKSAEQRYYVDAAELWSIWDRPEGELAVPLGEDRNGNPVVIEFSSTNSPHLLIGGTTGSGKSEALTAILYGLVRHYSDKELRLLLIDPKGTELVSFEDAPHLDQSIGWDDVDAISILQGAVAEMQKRYELFKQARKRSIAEYNSSISESDKLPWILLVLDEYADLTSDRDSKKAIEQELKRLAQKARASGIHIIIATQKPSGEVISTDLRSNLPAQLALRVRSGVESRVIMEESGAEMLNGRGDGFLRRVGRLERVQCALVKKEDQIFSKFETP